MFGDTFWVNLRDAVRPVASELRAATSGLDEQQLDRLFRSAARWLTPGAVADFVPEDFSFLDRADLDDLLRGEEGFRRVAGGVPEGHSATRDQVEAAAAALGEVVRLLRPDEVPDLETFKVQYLVDRALRTTLPGWVEALRCELGTDVTNDPAVWVWLTVSQEAVENDLVVKQGQQVREKVEAAIRRLRLDRWPYVRFQDNADPAPVRKRRR